MKNLVTKKEYFIWFNADKNTLSMGLIEEFEQDKSKSIHADKYQLICRSGRQRWVFNEFKQLVKESKHQRHEIFVDHSTVNV